ncbi:MAG: phosphoribosylglycinamide formyltransferase [Alphaproteobacteria bacterium]|nr:phosphoribosylglycinamide formyltransferase [Alphaproteobacteria bacterium]
MGTQKLNLAILISGSGSNLQALIDACSQDNFPAKINIVISNQPNAYGLKRAEKAGIPTKIINHKDYDSRESFDKALLETLSMYQVDLICLAGFMRILTKVFVQKWEGKILNTHPALLPKHGGKGMFGLHVHKAVLDAGDSQSGVSIHMVTEECDRGTVILQHTVNVKADDTPETLAARVLEQEHIAYPKAVRSIAEKQL